MPTNLFRPQRGQQSEAGEDLGMFIPEGPEDEHFVYDVTFKDILQVVKVDDYLKCK